MAAVPKEILDKVHRIEIQAGRLVDDLFAGEYHPVFKGHGLEFAEVRGCQAGAWPSVSSFSESDSAISSKSSPSSSPSPTSLTSFSSAHSSSV